MTHALTLSDEDYLRLESAAQATRKTPEQLLSNLISGLPTSSLASDDQYDRRWSEFMDVVGSVQQGQPLTNEQIDELIGEEAATTHAANSSNAAASA